MKKLIIDRFEGHYAICEQEDKTMVSIPKYKLPLHCKEGECLFIDSEGMYQIDQENHNLREKRIFDKMSRLFE
jgi:hypothetical protein